MNPSQVKFLLMDKTYLNSKRPQCVGKLASWLLKAQSFAERLQTTFVTNVLRRRLPKYERRLLRRDCRTPWNGCLRVWKQKSAKAEWGSLWARDKDCSWRVCWLQIHASWFLMKQRLILTTLLNWKSKRLWPLCERDARRL